eukprot:TRINITY_DN255_c1_g1_i2.p1 TRINITY_DN255_c1_g1~~TRINITY_DN255_c1_g1_i2.p1  ORF type:complete len:241 (+),score=6.36 TRINITY_DN255_c1_g1_i2:36-758(+)
MFNHHVTFVCFAFAAAYTSLVLQGCGIDADDDRKQSCDSTHGNLATNSEKIHMVADRRDTSSLWRQATCINSRFQCNGPAQWCATVRASCLLRTFLAVNQVEGRAPSSCLKRLDSDANVSRDLCVVRKNVSVDTVLCKIPQDGSFQVFECNGPESWCYDSCARARNGKRCFSDCSLSDEEEKFPWQVFFAMGAHLQCEEKLTACIPSWTSTPSRREGASKIDLDNGQSVRQPITAHHRVV